MEPTKKKGISPIFAIIIVIGIFLIVRQFILKPLANANGNRNTVTDPSQSQYTVPGGSTSTGNATTAIGSNACPRCLGKGYVDESDISRLGKTGVWKPGKCSLCNGTGKINGTSAPAPVNAAVVANNVVNEWKNPVMKSDRIQWMQNGYNRYARNKQKYGPGMGKTGSVAEWVIIPEDGVFGKGTHEAVKRVMTNTAKASWAQFKARLVEINNVNFPGHPIY